VDETMIAWDAGSSQYKDHGVPHLTKIKSKPVPIGIEIKGTVDMGSGIYMHMEVQEGKESMKMKEFGPEAPNAEERQPHHTAVTLRAVKSLFGSGRTIIMDSYFGSVNTIEQLRKKGLNGIGIVKTATKGYPTKQMDDFEKSKPDKGKFITFKCTNSADVPTLFAVGYRPGGTDKVKRIISSCSNTLPGPTHKRKKLIRAEIEGVEQVIETIEQVPRPNVIADLFNNFNGVDHHDLLRQGLLDLERVGWATQKWHIRVISSIISICIVDSYLIWKMENEKVGLAQKKEYNLFEYCANLAFKLINNAYLSETEHAASNNDSSDENFRVSSVYFNC